MDISKNVSSILHRMRVRLYPNYLPASKGAFIARTASEASLSVEQVCLALRERGGYSGRQDELVAAVKGFLNEAAYQLCDGYMINLGYFAIAPGVAGSFNSATEIADRERHPVEFRFYPRAPLRKLAENISVEVESISNVVGYVGEFVDAISGAVNETVTPGGVFIIKGHRIKVSDEDQESGVYFKREGGDEMLKVSIIVENAPSKIIAIAPALIPGEKYRVMVVTRHTGVNGKHLKTPRTFAGDFTITAGG